MSDKEKFSEEEYHFVDDPDMGTYEEPTQIKEESTPESTVPPAGTKLDAWLKPLTPFIDLVKNNFMLRTALIVVVIVLIATIIYSCSTNPLAKKTTVISVVPKTAARHRQAVVPVVQPMASETLVPSAKARYEEKLSRVEQAQTDLQSQVNTLSNQLSGATTNLSAMTDNLKRLSEQVMQLTALVQAQSKMAAVLSTHALSRSPKKMPVHKQSVQRQPTQYFLQAIIPGRAWLMSAGGDTLTVREGTRVASYGVVRYIDAKRGRVLTSSGQVIRFSQEDS